MSDDSKQATNSLNAILSTLQQGVQAINNLTQAMKLIFPSST